MKVEPGRCGFFFGVPTSEVPYLKSTSLTGSYASQFLGGWIQFEALWVRDVARFSSHAQALGSKVVLDVSVEVLADALGGNKFDAVILFSNWSTAGLELAGIFQSVEKVVETIPFEYRGIIDLCVCHPDSLVEAIYTSRPNCLLRYVPEKARPDLWLLYYEHFLILLKRGEDYEEAMKKLTIAILKLRA